MKSYTPLLAGGLTAALLCISWTASAGGGVISAEAASVVHARPANSSDARGRQLATLESYLMADTVTVGLAPGDQTGWQANSIQRGIRIWADSIPDCPFTLVDPGQKPMIVVKFVNSIESGGDIQGQVEAIRSLRWGASVSYKISGTLLVRLNTGNHELKEDELSEVVAHELGHVLGLDDATDCVGLMGPFVPGRPRLAPSKGEVKAVEDYRAQLRQEIAKLQNK
ncbi:MAG TPA: hypothetical protein VMI31_00570 [Fimbriimonadaceae bacterium]|nr:hypothetical protein [Fimbriimonadaceae bacterium]